LLYNEFPEDGTLEKYGLRKLAPLVSAVRWAEVGSLKEYIANNTEYLMKMRLWALTAKLYHVVYRNVRRHLSKVEY